LTVTGSGIVYLNNVNNSYAGGTTISGGTLQINSFLALGSGSLSVGAGTLRFNSSLSSSDSFSITNAASTIDTQSNNATLSGIISGAGALSKIGNGTLTLSGTNTYSGGTSVNTGTLILGNSTAMGTDGVSVGSSAILNVNGYAPTVTSLTGAGSITLGAGTLTAGSSNATSTFSGIISGTGSLIKTGTGTLTLNNYSTTGQMTVSAGRLVLPSHKDSRTSALTIGASPAVLDVRDGGLVVLAPTGGGSAAQTQARAIRDLVLSGTNGSPLFTGPGITSSVAAANAGSALFAVGWIQNNNAAIGTSDGTATTGSTPITTSFGIDNVPASLNDTLVRYTYYGDADLSGTVDDTDYFLIDQGFANGSSGWINGDFDGNGMVDDTDYFLIDNAAAGQGSHPLTEGFEPLLRSAVAVPEPASISGFFGCAVPWLLKRRR
jgi:autotransporter-associated beta strand protein